MTSTSGSVPASASASVTRGNYTLGVPEATAAPDGKAFLEAGAVYSIMLINRSSRDCDCMLTVEGVDAGVFRIAPRAELLVRNSKPRGARISSSPDIADTAPTGELPPFSWNPSTARRGAGAGIISATFVPVADGGTAMHRDYTNSIELTLLLVTEEPLSAVPPATTSTVQVTASPTAPEKQASILIPFLAASPAASTAAAPSVATETAVPPAPLPQKPAANDSDSSSGRRPVLMPPPAPWRLSARTQSSR